MKMKNYSLNNSLKSFFIVFNLFFFFPVALQWAEV